LTTMSCAHTTEFDDRSWVPPEPDNKDGCFDCEAMGANVWAHLRMCLSCGHIACCDSSPHNHATRHNVETGHPVMRSFEPGEQWRWCYADQRIV